MNTTDTTSDKMTPNYLEEWKQARSVLQFFDDKLHDLRKYGFSFLTALLTAESFLATGTNQPTDAVKLAVLCVTLLLIVALYLLDTNYRVFQEATATRALVLERRLNLELSDVIAYRYGIGEIAAHVLLLYCLFVFGVLVLGWFSLCGCHWCVLGVVLAASTLLAWGYIIWLNRRGIRYRCGDEDWTVSRLECSVHDPTIRITVNNLTRETESMDGLVEPNGAGGKPPSYAVPKPIVFAAKHIIWRIKSAKDEKVVQSESADAETKVYDSHTWSVTLPKIAGVYHLHPRDWPVPLFTIVVTD
ncbi:MAG: hypothetical protein ACLPT4_15550 [Verrucomicrobiia bacterium]